MNMWLIYIIHGNLVLLMATWLGEFGVEFAIADPTSGCPTTLGKLFTPLCHCHRSIDSDYLGMIK